MSNVVFKEVETKEELDIFHQVKRSVWESTGYDMEYVKEGSDAYIAYVDGIPGGTFEFTPYNDKTRPFIRDLFDGVLSNSMKVTELDSFAVLPEYRGKLGREIVRFMIYYAKTKGYTHGIGISAPTVFESFNNSYHIRSEKVKETIWYKGDDVIPTLFHLKETYENLNNGKYSWYETPMELKTEVLV